MSFCKRNSRAETFPKEEAIYVCGREGKIIHKSELYKIF